MKIKNDNMIKTLILTNPVVTEYCKSKHIDIDRLYQADIKELPDMYAFTRPSEFKRPADAPLLAHDLDTQPRVLIAVETIDKSLHIVETEYTCEIVMS